MRLFKRHASLTAFLAVWLTVEPAVGPASFAVADTLRSAQLRQNATAVQELQAGLEEKTNAVAEETVRLAEGLPNSEVTERMVNDVAWKLGRQALDEVLRVLWDRVWRKDPYWMNFKREQEYMIQLGDYSTRNVGISEFLFEILRHPLANAADAWADEFRETRGYQDGEIKIRAFIKGGNLLIQILDKGPGVPKELRRLLGKEFIQSPKKGRLGTSGQYGLGVLMATRTAKAEGWRFTVSGRKDVKGTVASLVIPLSPPNSSAGVEEVVRREIGIIRFFQKILQDDELARRLNLPVPMPGFTHPEKTYAALDDLELSGDEQLLEMGSGIGAVAIAASIRVKKSVGVELLPDQHRSAIAITKELAGEHVIDPERIELKQGDAMNENFADYDLIFWSKGESYTFNREELIQKFIAEARPGTRLVIQGVFPMDFVLEPAPFYKAVFLPSARGIVYIKLPPVGLGENPTREAIGKAELGHFLGESFWKRMVDVFEERERDAQLYAAGESILFEDENNRTFQVTLRNPLIIRIDLVKFPMAEEWVAYLPRELPGFQELLELVAAENTRRETSPRDTMDQVMDWEMLSIMHDFLKEERGFGQYGTQLAFKRLSTAGVEEPQTRMEEFVRSLVLEGKQGLTPVVIGAALEAAHPELRVLSRLKDLLVLFAGGLEENQMAVELITRFDAREVVFAGTEEEAGRFIPILAAAGIKARAVTPERDGHLILAILAQAAGMEERDLAGRAGQFLDDLTALAGQV